MLRRTTLGLALLLGAFPLPAQDPSPDAALKAAFDGWEAKWRGYAEVMKQARSEGRIRKGGARPDDVQARLDAADAARDALLARFGGREDLSASSYVLLARVHERARDYASAVRAYQRSLDEQAPELATLHALCLAAMNSKDNVLAARWMQRTIEVEDDSDGARRNLSVRTSYYPRTLIALGDWTELEVLLAKLAEDDAPRCRAAATTFGIVVAIERGELDRAQRRVDAICRAPEVYPDHQSWAVLVQLALSVGRGQFDQGAKAVHDHLAATEGDSAPKSAADRNRRRYLAAVAPFLGEPAPAIRVDEWVGGAITAEPVLESMRGTVVVLDFWQPWCEPCRKAMPHLVALQDAHPEKLTVIGLCKVEDYGYDVSERRAVRPIAAQDYADHVVDFDLDMGLNYPLGIAHTAVNNQTYHVAGIPTLVVIDRQGVVRYMSCGAGEPGLLELAIEGVLRAR